MLCPMERYANGASVKTTQSYLDIYFDAIHIFTENPHIGAEIQLIDKRAFGIVDSHDAPYHFQTFQSAYVKVD